MVSPSVSAESKGFSNNNRQKLILQPLDQQWQPTTQNYNPAITSIYSEPRPDGQDRLYVETFLIDAVSAPNKKGWRVSYENPADFDSRVQASKNHPLVLFQTPHPTKDGEMIFDHPVAPITSLEAAADPLRATIEFQKKYTIGYARHFKKVKDGVWHAVYEIVNPKAKRFFQKAKEKGLKLFTSPHIVRPASEPDRTNIKEWALIHNAIVSNPANNQAIASIKDIKAVKSKFPVDFSSLFASMDTQDDDDETFDAEYLLDIYTNEFTSHDNNSDNLTNMPETASTSTANNTTPQQVSTVTTFDPTNGQTSQNQHLVSSPSQQQELQNVPPETKEQQKTQEQDSSKSELETLKAQIDTLSKQNQELQAKYAQDTRKAQIEKLFAPIVGQLYADPKTGILNEKEYNTEVNRLMKSNHSFDEISELLQARFVLAQYHSQKTNEKASVTSQESESASFPYTKMLTNNNPKVEAGIIAANESLGVNVLRKLNGGLY